MVFAGACSTGGVARHEHRKRVRGRPSAGRAFAMQALEVPGCSVADVELLYEVAHVACSEAMMPTSGADRIELTLIGPACHRLAIDTEQQRDLRASQQNIVVARCVAMPRRVFVPRCVVIQHHVASDKHIVIQQRVVIQQHVASDKHVVIQQHVLIQRCVIHQHVVIEQSAVIKRCVVGLRHNRK
jgi:hypothetical protein